MNPTKNWDEEHAGQLVHPTLSLYDFFSLIFVYASTLLLVFGICYLVSVDPGQVFDVHPPGDRFAKQ